MQGQAIGTLNTDMNRDCIRVNAKTITITSIPSQSGKQIRWTPDPIDGYEPLIAFYCGQTLTSDLVPYVSSALPNNDGTFSLGVRNLTTTAISTANISVLTMYTK